MLLLHTYVGNSSLVPFLCFQRSTLKNTGRPGYEARQSIRDSIMVYEITKLHTWYTTKIKYSDAGQYGGQANKTFMISSTFSIPWFVQYLQVELYQSVEGESFVDQTWHDLDREEHGTYGECLKDWVCPPLQCLGLCQSSYSARGGESEEGMREEARRSRESRGRGEGGKDEGVWMRQVYQLHLMSCLM